MARLIELKQGNLRVLIAPDNGGMIAQILVDEVPVLKLDESALEITPMSAGGCPVLFPFAGKVSESSYDWDGKTYTMPAHGLVKNAPFAVRYHDEAMLVLWRSGCRSEAANYPFDYDLELVYRLEDGALYTVARIHNLSSRPMPHAMAWHPYFKATQKERLRFCHRMKVHYDYIKIQDEPAAEKLDLSEWYDDVFHTPAEPGFSLENPVDGYGVRCMPDGHYPVMVVCSWVDGAVCIEPWCGIPDSIKNGRFLQIVPPGQAQQLVVMWTFSKGGCTNE